MTSRGGAWYFLGMKGSLLLTMVCTSVLVCEGAAAQPPAPAEEQWVVPDPSTVREINRRAAGFALSSDMGLWGTGFGHGIRFDVGLGQYFALRVRGIAAYGDATASETDPVIMGGLELIGRSPVIYGVLRAYGGGGVRAGGRPDPHGRGDKTGVGGGGYMGLEFFTGPALSWSLEVGGQSAVHAKKLDAGPSVMGAFGYHF